MADCSELKNIANEKRIELLGLTNYSIDNPYGANHADANQAIGNNDPLNLKGRGTGIPFDTSFEVGNTFDKEGDVNVSGSGRKAVFTNKYNINNPYNCV